MRNIPVGEEDVDGDRLQGMINIGDEYAGFEDENANDNTENRPYKDSIDDPDSFRDNLEDR